MNPLQKDKGKSNTRTDASAVIKPKISKNYKKKKRDGKKYPSSTIKTRKQ